MFLVCKYQAYKRQQKESNKRKITERELSHLNHKIDKLLLRLDEHELEPANHPDEECVICISAKATMQTFPCGHRVVCRKCFVKTIQVAVSQRLLPLRCVICRTKILRLKQTSFGGINSTNNRNTATVRVTSNPGGSQLRMTHGSTTKSCLRTARIRPVMSSPVTEVLQSTEYNRLSTSSVPPTNWTDKNLRSIYSSSSASTNGRIREEHSFQKTWASSGHAKDEQVLDGMKRRIEKGIRDGKTSKTTKLIVTDVNHDSLLRTSRPFLSGISTGFFGRFDGRTPTESDHHHRRPSSTSSSFSRSVSTHPHHNHQHHHLRRSKQSPFLGSIDEREELISTIIVDEESNNEDGKRLLEEIADHTLDLSSSASFTPSTPSPSTSSPTSGSFHSAKEEFEESEIEDDGEEDFLTRTDITMTLQKGYFPKEHPLRLSSGSLNSKETRTSRETPITETVKSSKSIFEITLKKARNLLSRGLSRSSLRSL